MPFIKPHPIYSSGITGAKTWVAPKAKVLIDGKWHDPNEHPHYEKEDAKLYPWTASSFPRIKGSWMDKYLRERLKEKYRHQREEGPVKGNQFGFREGVEPVYGPECPRSRFHKRNIIQKNLRAIPTWGRWG